MLIRTAFKEIRIVIHKCKFCRYMCFVRDDGRIQSKPVGVAGTIVHFSLSKWCYVRVTLNVTTFIDCLIVLQASQMI